MHSDKMKKARHDMGNALSIAQASVEAMLDGVAGITDSRLNRLRDLLASVSDSMYALTSDADVAAPEDSEDAREHEIGMEVAALVPVAEAKGVRLIYDAETANIPLKTALLKAVREARSGSTVRVTAGGEGIVQIRTEPRANGS